MFMYTYIHIYTYNYVYIYMYVCMYFFPQCPKNPLVCKRTNPAHFCHLGLCHPVLLFQLLDVTFKTEYLIGMFVHEWF